MKPEKREGPWEFSKWNAYQSLTQQTLPTIGSFMLHYAWIRYIGMAPGKLPGLKERCMLGKGKCHLPVNLKDERKRGIELINQMYEGFILYYLSLSLPIYHLEFPHWELFPALYELHLWCFVDLTMSKNAIILVHPAEQVQNK